MWNEIFLFAQEEIDIPRGTIKATILLENILLAFEIDEVLYEMREHIVGMNAGRWDYISSAIKKFRNRKDIPFPDREQITMTVPFMQAYTAMLVKTCHKRDAHAIGGMATFVPRKEPRANEIAYEMVAADIVRESQEWFDGTWVAHPRLVHSARKAFVSLSRDKPHQKERTVQCSEECV